MFRCLTCDQRGPGTCRNSEDDGQGKVDWYFVLKQVLEVPEETLEAYLRRWRDLEVNLCAGCEEKVDWCKRLWMDYLEVKRELVGKIKQLEGIWRNEEDQDILEETRNFVKMHNYEESMKMKGFLEVGQVEVKKEEMEEATDEEDKEDDPFLDTQEAGEGFDEEEIEEPGNVEADVDQEMEETTSDPDFEEDAQTSEEEEGSEASEEEEFVPKRQTGKRKAVTKKRRDKTKKYVHNRSLKCPFCSYNCSPCDGDRFCRRIAQCLQKLQTQPDFNPDNLPQLVCPYCNKYKRQVDLDLQNVVPFVEHTVWCQYVSAPIPGYDQGIPLKWRVFQCALCHADNQPKYMKVKEFLNHYRSHKRYIYQCPLCPQQNICFHNTTGFRQHWMECHSDQMTSGPIGQQKVLNPNPPLPHVPWWCPQCNQEFPSDLLRNQHCTNVHPDYTLELVHKCDQCSSSFLCQEELQLHQGTVHLPKNCKWECTPCQEIFENHDLFQKHLVKFHTQISCDLCEEPFQGKKALQEHRLSNHKGEWRRKRLKPNSEKVEKCPVCDKVFSHVKTLRIHLKNSHLEKGSNLCEICGKAISTRGMKLHLQTKHGIGTLKKHTCSVASCGKVFYKKDVFEIHQFKHKPRKDWPFHCSSCGAAFLTKNKVTRHELRHTNVNSRSFMCDQCPKSFRVEDDLYSHKRQVHQKKMPEEINKCEICGRTFVKLASLERHKDLVHEKKFEVECDLCGSSFLDGTRLKMHKKLAHGGDSGGDHQGNGGNKREKKHKCGVCGKAFATNFMLSDHSTTHGGEPKYKCSYNNCGKAFYNYIAWHRHVKGVHENRDEKRFKCEICKKGFAHANYLNRHKKTHKK